MTNIPRDDNNVPTLNCVSNTDENAVTPVHLDPTSHLMEVDDDVVGKLSDSYGTANRSINIDLFSVSTNGVSQSFTGDGNVLDSIQVMLVKTGSPTGNTNVKIYAHAGTYGTSSEPTGAALATSANLDVSTISTTITLYNFSFTGANEITLENGTFYNLAVEYSGGDSSNKISVGCDNTSPTHGGNNALLSAGSWTPLSILDTVFYLYTQYPQSITRDDNRVPIAIGVSSDDGTTPVPIYADSSNGKLLINSN